MALSLTTYLSLTNVPLLHRRPSLSPMSLSFIDGPLTLPAAEPGPAWVRWAHRALPAPGVPFGNNTFQATSFPFYNRSVLSPLGYFQQVPCFTLNEKRTERARSSDRNIGSVSKDADYFQHFPTSPRISNMYSIYFLFYRNSAACQVFLGVCRGCGGTLTAISGEL